MPEGALLGMIGARRVTCGRPDAAIFLLNKILVAQVFCRTIAPFLAYAFVQTLGESLSQAISDSLGHDGVVVVVFGLVRFAQLLQADPAGDCERANMVG